MKCLRCRHRGSCRLFAGRVARSQYPLRPFGPIPTTTLNVSDRQTRYTRGERVRCGTDSPLSSSPARQKGSRQTNGSRRRELVGLTQKRADLVRVVHCGDANDVATSAPGSFHANKSRGGECAEWVARVQRGRRKQRGANLHTCKGVAANVADVVARMRIRRRKVGDVICPRAKGAPQTAGANLHRCKGVAAMEPRRAGRTKRSRIAQKHSFDANSINAACMATCSCSSNCLLRCAVLRILSNSVACSAASSGTRLMHIGGMPSPLYGP